MEEIWNSKSSIEEKHSASLTPQINQFRINFSIRDIYDKILKTLLFPYFMGFS